MTRSVYFALLMALLRHFFIYYCNTMQ